MNGFVKAVALKFVQSAVMAGGAWLAAKGFSANDVQGFEGSAIFLAGFAFHIYDAFVVDKKISTAASTGQVPK